MNYENYEGTAIDPETFGQLDADTEQAEVTETADIETEEVVDDVAKDVEVENEQIETPVVEETQSTSFNVDGIGEVSVDDIKEWKNGHLRQSDYTKKTQELAKQREQMQDAVNLYNYMKERPYLIDSIKQAENNPEVLRKSAPTQENQKLQELLYNQKAMETDLKLTELHNKYGDFDDAELFQTAVDMNVKDLEFALKAVLFERKSDVDTKEITKQELEKELEKNRDVVSTVVSTKRSNIKSTPKLTAQEKHIANELGISEREYLKWKN